jgi:hypothetical protein
VVGGLSNLFAHWVRRGVVVAALCLGASLAGGWVGWQLAPEGAGVAPAAVAMSPHTERDNALARPPLLEVPIFVDHAAALLEEQLIERSIPDAVIAVESRAVGLSVAAPAVQAVPAAALPTTPAPPLGPGQTQTVSLSFYYCGANGGPRVGDGGGFCGHMANGDVVHAGAAACAASQMGQRFRVEGDPYGRVYTCTDTGGAVGSSHRDIWFDDAGVGWAWLQTVGFTATIEVVE